MADLHQSEASDDLPMYHNHLMDTIDTKNPQRNDSRST